MSSNSQNPHVSDNLATDLTLDDIEALAWASAATAENAHIGEHYDEKHVSMLAQMSFNRHRMLKYEMDQTTAPKTINSVDNEANQLFFPETKEEKAWGLRSITHKKLPIKINSHCEPLAYVTDKGEIIVLKSQAGNK